MPFITVVGTDEVNPHIAQVLRNDQTITWRLAENLAWDPVAGDKAVQFKEETTVYSRWPGSEPIPTGEAPSEGPDRRDYTADTQHQMEDRAFQAYHYKLAVIDIITNERAAVRGVRGREWYDPEVVNEPRP
jgi:hypothetical protein